MIEISEWSDAFSAGVLAALGVVYDAGEDSLAEEIVYACGARETLRVAKAQGDPYLPSIKRTVKELSRRKWMERDGVIYAR